MMTIDSKTLAAWGPFEVEARLHPDLDSTPYDADCYTDKQIEAWKNDEWSYVGLEVVVSFEGAELGFDSLWGIEYGHFTMTDEDDNVLRTEFLDPLDNDDTYPLDDVLAQAQYDAEQRIKRLTEAVA